MQHEPYSWSQFRAEGKERAKLSNAEASERTKLRNYKIERFFGRKSSNAINPQQDSLLLTLLPQELRDQIWQSILEPPADAKATHFHIYDEVYDSCTHRHHPVEATTAWKRFSRTQIALLLTCRRIYNEAVHYLWGQNLFTFVVMAGLPRGHSKYDRHVCKSLGKLKDCERLFRQIRSLVIVIQPGRNPHVELYNERLQELLQVLEHGKHLCNLTLIFNYRVDVEKYDPQHLKRRQIAEALYPFKKHTVSKIAARQCQLTLLFSTIEHTAEPDPDGHDNQYSHMMKAITGIPIRPRSKIPLLKRYPSQPLKPGSRTPPETRRIFLGNFDLHQKAGWDFLESQGADAVCLARGAYGREFSALPPQQRPTVQTSAVDCVAGVVGLVGGLALLPITVPVGIYAAIRRKKKKGEWK